MMPTASPRRISKLTSLSAQTSSRVSPWMMGLPLAPGLWFCSKDCGHSASAHRAEPDSDLFSAWWPMMYFLPRFSALMTMSDIDVRVSKLSDLQRFFPSSETGYAQPEKEGNDARLSRSRVRKWGYRRRGCTSGNRRSLPPWD